MHRAILCLLLSSFAAGAPHAAPQRIVSLNLCTDALLLVLADPARVASVTWLARDARVSPVSAQAQAVAVNHGLAEEVLPIAPDLVLAGRYTAVPTTALLQRLGVRVMVFEPANSLGEYRTSLLRLAAAIGESQRARTMLQHMDERLAHVRARSGPRLSAVVYQANGYTLGEATLADELLGIAGFENLAPSLALYRTGHLPLERLVMADPDVLIFPELRSGEPSLAHALLAHPALRALGERASARGRRATVVIEDRLWDCAGPWVAEAVERLAGVRADLLRTR